jgi:hypothetical protein
MNQNIETIQNKWGFGINELKEVLNTDINIKISFIFLFYVL